MSRLNGDERGKDKIRVNVENSVEVMRQSKIREGSWPEGREKQ